MRAISPLRLCIPAPFRFAAPLSPLLLLGLAFLFTLLRPSTANAQTNWNKDGNSYTTIEDNAIVEITLPSMAKTTLVTADQLGPLGLQRREGAGNRAAGNARRGFGGGGFQYQFSVDKQKVLLFTKPVRIYHNTFYTCCVFNRADNTLTPMAKSVPAPGILNAKLSPDGSKLGYVYDNNIYTEDLATHATTWLQQFPYRTHISWWIIAAAGAGALLITFATVSYQTIKAALTNPTTSLRSE